MAKTYTVKRGIAFGILRNRNLEILLDGPRLLNSTVYLKVIPSFILVKS